jgi:hypothetical protein
VDELVVEGMLVVAAGRAYAHSRPPVLALPRRGSQDLPDRDAPERSPSEPQTLVLRSRGATRWRLTASVGIAAVVGGVIARAAVLLI